MGGDCPERLLVGHACPQVPSGIMLVHPHAYTKSYLQSLPLINRKLISLTDVCRKELEDEMIYKYVRTWVYTTGSIIGLASTIGSGEICSLKTAKPQVSPKSGGG